MRRKLAFLDGLADGRVPVWDYRTYEGARMLRDQGFSLVVATHQPGVAYGRFGEAVVECLERSLRCRLRQEGLLLHGFYWCPHDPSGRVPPFAKACACRKPGPGLLLKAAQDLNADLRRSWTFGDVRDVEAGRQAGCRAALLDDGGERDHAPGFLRTPDLAAPDLLAAARSVVSLAV